MNANPVLVELTRAGTIESWHRGALAIVDAQGRPVLTLGDVERPIFPRSAAKLLQALPLVASGAADAIGLQDDELALACASHSGEPGHAQTARAMLGKAGLDVDALECGPQAPRREADQRQLWAAGQAPCALHHNCSGKHAGMLGLARRLAGERGLPARTFAAGYIDPDHPVQRAVAQAIGLATGCDVVAAPRAIDGCSVPTWALPLSGWARAFARVAGGRGMPDDLLQAAARLRRAIAAHPWQVGGTDRFDTDVMRAFGDRVCCKVGAEGVYAAALPELGLGIALKIDDGQAARAAEVAMAEVLWTLLATDAAQAEVLQARRRPAQPNARGRIVGELAATADLRQALAACP